jgi:hypothetical protein
MIQFQIQFVPQVPDVAKGEPAIAPMKSIGESVGALSKEFETRALAPQVPCSLVRIHLPTAVIACARTC